jgi:molybdopterin biosynthesis enzyme MoaB
LTREIPVFSVRIKGTLLVGAGYHAIPATSTFIVINIDYPIFSLDGSPAGADFHTNGLFAVIAEHRIHIIDHLRIFSCFTG